MRNTRGNGFSSRVEMRKNKTNRWLNWTVGIVSILILAVGCIILISVFSTSSADKTASQSNHSSVQSGTNSGTSNNSTSASSGGTGSDQVSNSESASSSASGTAASSSASSAASQSADESHQASYDMGSADWNAQVKAIAGATGIDQGNMVILWLGNGGSSNSSLARVASKSAQSSVYVVHLIYQNGKWQADQVQKP
ncbi:MULTISPECIES: YrrS family protein [unclassified Sporolactobacillus]|uniref:YrrS family protein n=1 Tax=unclassified Sporolactobacillus TaxID=2628533 RepID=UPI00236747A8|nr:YrrS family protein [Sporolactobacillus sp. CQH2019]MDD9147632.1 YrrS family protein [Sporolactobacillus sp. CQH2019]